MSLFKRIQNKRYDLQEIKKKYVKNPKVNFNNNNNNNNTNPNKVRTFKDRYKKYKTYLKNKNIRKGIGKALLGTTPKGKLVRGALYTAGTLALIDKGKKIASGDTAKPGDFTFTGPIVDKSTGQDIRYSYAGNNQLPLNTADRNKYVTNKLKSGNFGLKYGKGNNFNSKK